MFKKIIKLFFYLVCVFIAALLIIYVAVFSPDIPGLHVKRQATLAVVSGVVEIQRGGSYDWIPASSGDLLRSRDKVRVVAEGSARLESWDGNVLEMPAGTKVSIGALRSNRLTGRSDSYFRVAWGTVSAVVEKVSPKRRFNVRMPVAILGVRGTRFSVQVAMNGDSAVRVREGEVSSSFGDAKDVIAAGGAARFKPEALPSYSMLSARMVQNLPLLKEYAPSPEQISKLRELREGIPRVGQVLRQAEQLRRAGTAPTPEMIASMVKDLPPIDEVLRYAPSVEKQEQLLKMAPPPDELRDLFFNAPSEMRRFLPRASHMRMLLETIPTRKELDELFRQVPSAQELESIRALCPPQYRNRVPTIAELEQLKTRGPSPNVFRVLEEYVAALEKTDILK